MQLVILIPFHLGVYRYDMHRESVYTLHSLMKCIILNKSSDIFLHELLTLFSHLS